MALTSARTRVQWRPGVPGAVLHAMIPAATLAAIAWFMAPALQGAYTEGFQPTLVMNAQALLQGRHGGVDPLYRLDNDFFFSTRLGVSAVLAALMEVGLSGAAAFRAVMLATLAMLLAANAAILVKRHQVHPALACIPALLFPGLFESAWFFNDNVLSAALSTTALALAWTRPPLGMTALAAALWGLAVACRTDAVLLAPAFAALLWFEHPDWPQRLRHAAVAVPIAAAVPILVYASLGFDFFDVVGLTRQATAAWARTDPWRRVAYPFLKGISLPGIILLATGAWTVAARRRWREIVLCLLAPVLYGLAYGRMLTEVRYLLPLSPFFGILMVEGARALAHARPARRRLGTAVLAAAALLCFVPPVLIPPRALFFLSTDHDMPRPFVGRFWSPVLGMWWDRTLRDGEGAIAAALDAEAAAGAASAAGAPGVVVSTYWTPDRMVDLTLRGQGFAAVPRGAGGDTLPAACREIGELFARGGERMLHLRAHIPMLPTQHEPVTWRVLGQPCLRALDLPAGKKLLVVGWMQMNAPPPGLNASGTQTLYRPELDLRWWSGRSIAAETYAYDTALAPEAAVPGLLTPVKDEAEEQAGLAAILHRDRLQ